MFQKNAVSFQITSKFAYAVDIATFFFSMRIWQKIRWTCAAASCCFYATAFAFAYNNAQAILPCCTCNNPWMCIFSDALYLKGNSYLMQNMQ